MKGYFTSIKIYTLLFFVFFDASLSLAVLTSDCPTDAVLEDVHSRTERAVGGSKISGRTEPFRQIGVLVTLEDGKQVLAVGGSVSCQHDYLLDAIETKYGKKVKSIAWGGELELAPSADGKLKIIQANETSSHLAKQLNVPSDSTALQTAVGKLAQLKWDLPTGYSPKYDKDREHLHPSMKNRHALNNKLAGPQMVFEALSDRLREGDSDFENTRTRYAGIAKKNLGDLGEWVEGIRNDRIITDEAAARFMEVVSRFMNNGPVAPEEFHYMFQEFTRFEDEIKNYQNSLVDQMSVFEVSSPANH